MISISNIKDFSQPKSALKESSTFFVARFESNWRNLVASCKEIKLSKNFALGEEKSQNGFIQDLSQCFANLGLKSLSLKCEHYVKENKNIFALKEFLNEILTLHTDQLRLLAKMHSDVVQTNPGEIPDEHFRDIILHFEKVEHKSIDRIEAGHLIMLLSQLAIDVLGLKTIFNEFNPLTIERIDEILETQNPKNVNQHQKSIDDALESIILIQNSLNKNESNLIDLKLWNNTLSRQRRDVLKWMLVNSSEGLQGSRERLQKAMRGLKAWGEWKILCRYDERAESAMSDDEFSSVVSHVKERLQEFSQGIIDLLDSMETILNRGGSGISLYCQDLLSELKLVFENMVQHEGVHQNLKKLFQRVILRTQALNLKVKRQIEFELEELKELPETFQRRILYLSYEVPRILSRGNSKEIKNMALVVNYNYRLAKISMNKTSYENLPGDQKNNITTTLQDRMTKIVQNSTELVRMMMPAK